jgi:hypothetical protein
MKKELIRKEVWLFEDKIEALQELADKKGWSLKKYMETVLFTHAGKYINRKKSKTT